MKKNRLLALSVIFVLLLSGCNSANEETSPAEEGHVEDVQEVEQQEEELQEVESQEEAIEAAPETDSQADDAIEFSFRGTPLDKETDEVLYSEILDLLNRKTDLKMELESVDSKEMDVHDSITLNMTGEYETVLYRIKAADSWAYFEEKARKIYDDSYIQDVFTPYYLYNQYAEANGKLYRVEGDSVFGELDADSLKIWEQPGDNRYVVVADRYYDGGVKEIYIIRKTDDEDTKYKIVADTELWF